MGTNFSLVQPELTLINSGPLLWSMSKGDTLMDESLQLRMFANFRLESTDSVTIDGESDCGVTSTYHQFAWDSENKSHSSSLLKSQSISDVQTR